MRILCFGDSNTYGYDPRGYFGGRYDEENRWVDLLARQTGHEIINLGANGREIPRNPYALRLLTEHAPVDIFLVMLGTNDLLQVATAKEAAVRMENFLTPLLPHCNHILIVSPPPMKRGAWVPTDELVTESIRLAAEYRAVANRLNVQFIDTTDWHIELTFDGVHFTEEGHHTFAENLGKELPMTLEEIKLRRLAGQHLLAPADTQTVVKDLCGVQAQFMSNAFHALTIRCDTADTSDLVKNWTLRGTVHVFAKDDLPLFIRPEVYRVNDWSIPTWWNQRSDWALTPDRQKYFSDVILSALLDAPLCRDDLKALCRAEGMTDEEENSMFHPWGGGIRELCERGFLHYEPQEQKVFCLTPEFIPMAKADADFELARRYFTHFGPATIKDAAYFFGTTQRDIKKLLASLPITVTECEGKTFYYIENGTSPSREMPRCLFLAGFDQLMLGYEKKESIFLPQEHLRGIFNLAGIVYPALLIDGKVAGRWKKKNGKLTVTLFSPADQKLISDTAAELWSDLKQIEYLQK